MKSYGNSLVSSVKQYGVVGTVRRAVDTINVGLQSTSQNTYKFLQSQYSSIEKYISSSNALTLSSVGFFVSLGLTAEVSKGLVGILALTPKHPLALALVGTGIATFTIRYIICETYNWKPAPRNLNQDLQMVRDALISLSPWVVRDDGTIGYDYDVDDNWGGLGSGGDSGRIGPIVAGVTALMLIASTAASLAGNNSSVNNSDGYDGDYVELVLRMIMVRQR